MLLLELPAARAEDGSSVLTRIAAEVVPLVVDGSTQCELGRLPEQNVCSSRSTRMPDQTKKEETARLLAHLDQLVAQSQVLQRDIARRMQQDRADHQSVLQPLSPRRRAKRRRAGS